MEVGRVPIGYGVEVGRVPLGMGWRLVGYL